MAIEVTLNGPRKAIAQHMMQSLAGAAQLSFHTNCDITGLIEKRRQWKNQGRSISIEDCMIAALADAMTAHINYNGIVRGDTLEIKDDVDVAVAMSVNGLLLTPVVRNAGRISLDKISSARRGLSARAWSGDLKTSELVGGTVTLSNLGLSVVQHFTPILNRGQLVILGIGRVDERLAFDGKKSVVQRQEIGLSLTVDHRFIDGEPAALLLDHISGSLAGFSDER